jgi:hypothetical protein
MEVGDRQLQTAPYEVEGQRDRLSALRRTAERRHHGETFLSAHHFRLICAVRLELGGVSLVMPLNRQDQPINSDTLEGMLRPPRRCTIDLRIRNCVEDQQQKP